MSDLIDREAAKQLIRDNIGERVLPATRARLLAALDALPRVGGEEPSVKRPPMLLACCKSTGNWQWYMHDTYMNKSAWINSVYCSSKSEDLLAVDRTASDPEALKLYLEDIKGGN